jgi:hypothetical protein
MDQTAADMKGEEAQGPQNKQNDDDCREHFSSLNMKNI